MYTKKFELQFFTSHIYIKLFSELIKIKKLFRFSKNGMTNRQLFLLLLGSFQYFSLSLSLYIYIYIIYKS